MTTSKNRRPTARAETSAADARIASSITSHHQRFLEVLRLAEGTPLDRRTARSVQEVQTIVAVSALLVLRDLVNFGAVKMEVPDAADLMALAIRGLGAEYRKTNGSEDCPWGFLVLDWIGKDRLKTMMDAYDVVDGAVPV